MQTLLRYSTRLAVVLMLAVVGLVPSRAQAASLPATPCTGTGTVTCELWALPGSATVDGSTTVGIWGYAAASGGPAILPGPVLVATEGDTVQVTLHNALPETTAILFQGQSLVPDTAGVASGGTKTYTFVASRPGTFLYEAGLIPNSQHQVAMGLFGALVVRPSLGAGYAYDSASTAFAEETALVLSEVDPALNNSATPAGFDMRNYAPKFFLINGKAYPSTEAPTTAAGNTLLVRYINAGLQSHALSLLGLSQLAIATDGNAFAHPHAMVAETIAPGQTLDALVGIPPSAADGTQFALFDANLMLHNSNAAGFGGMLTFLTVGTPPPPPTGDTVGPLTSAVGLSPNATNGTVNVTVSASVSDATTGGSNVTAAEFYVDSTAGTPTPMSGAFGAPTASATGTLSTATLALLASGSHTVYVRGQDSAGNWGPFSSAVLNLDKTGPSTSALVISPNPANGTTAVALTGSASDTATGNSNIAAAEYFVDPVGAPANGSGSAMTVSPVAPTAGITASLAAPAVSALSNGTHLIKVHSQDAFGNWGALATVALTVDKAGPATSNLNALPNPNNGSMPFNTSTPAVRVTAGFSDAASGGSKLAGAEGFLDTVGVTGTGFVFIATDGAFNSVLETGYADIPLAVVGTLSQGNHTLSIHAKDAAGNWGALATTSLTIDKNLIFLNTFASAASPFGWSSVGGTAGRLTLTAGANLTGTGTLGLAALISGGTSGYVQDNSPTNETKYNARFYFNPNSLTTGTGGNPAAITIFSALNTANTTVFQVQYRRSTTTGYQVRLMVTRSGGTTSTNYVTLSNATHFIEVAWQSSGSATVRLYVDGAAPASQTLTGLNTSAFTLDTVRLGPQGTLPAGTPLGTLYFDAFYSTRNGAYIGP